MLRFILFFVFFVSFCSVTFAYTKDMHVKLQKCEVTDSAMFNAITDVIHSDSLQVWVQKYFYPNPHANIKKFRFTSIGFVNYKRDSSQKANATKNYITITYTNHIYPGYYTIYQNQLLFINEFSVNIKETSKYVKLLDKYNSFEYLFELRNKFVMLVFYYSNGNLHICTDEEDWIRNLQ